MSTETAIPRSCLNCGTDLQGRYCHACGQKDQERRLPFSHVMHEVLHDLWHLDAKVWQTLRALSLRPAFLTEEYLAGRRTAWVPPFRLYIVVTFVFFLLISFGKHEGIHFRRGAKASHAEGTPAASAVGAPAAPKGGFEGFIERGAKRASEDPVKAQVVMFRNFPRAMFLLLPVFALLLQGAFFDKRRYFVEHMAFSLHEHTYAFFVFILIWAAGWLPPAVSPWLTVPLFLTIPIHVGVGLRRMYGGGVLRTLASGALLGLVYLVVILTVLILTLLATLAQL
jgi:hypothetical protein